MQTYISKRNGARIVALLSVLTALVVSSAGVLTKDVKSAYAVSALVIRNPVAYNSSASTQILPQQTVTLSYQIYLPLVMNRWPPIPSTPTLNQIDNTDQNNLFTITWASVELGSTYVLEESTDPSFTNANIVYQGASLSWITPAQGKTPASYFYRLKAGNSWGDSSWSNIQSVTIYPLFVGLKLRWDGAGYIRFTNEYYNVGTHWENDLDILTDPDTIRSNNRHWYDPNPEGWATDTWFSYYSISTGQWKSSSVPDDPAWKWGYSWKLGYTSQFNNGQVVTIDGQAFTVSGPYAGYTAFGKAVQYWQFVNNNQFLYWDGGDWKQYCHPGDVTLRYDAGNNRLELYSSVMRRYYYQGTLTSNTVQYIENLTYANSFLGITPSATENLIPFTIAPQIDDDGYIQERPQRIR